MTKLLMINESTSIETYDKIIKGKEFSKIIECREIKAKIKKEAKNYKETVVKDCEKIKENAANEGFLEGMKIFDNHIAELEKKIEELNKEKIEKVTPIAISIAKKIIASELQTNPNIIKNVIEETILEIVDHSIVKIYVNKDDLKTVLDQKNALEAKFTKLQSLSILEREDLSKGDCIIETNEGIIDAKINNKLISLIDAFKNTWEN